MKILMLTPYLPYPLHSGGQIRSYHLIKNLSKKNEITLFSFIRSREEEQYIPELKKFCKTVKIFYRRPAWSPVNILLSGITYYPFLVCIYLSQSFNRAITQAIKQENFDLIHTETFYVMPNIPKTNIPIILVEQTIEHMVYKHFTDEFKWKLLLPLLMIDVKKIKYWESFFWKKAAKVIAVSETDKQDMQKLVPKINIEIVPNGIDAEWFEEKMFKKPHPPTVLYVGNFKWLQNVEAVEILVKKVWPVIKKLVPDAKLWIVGRSPDKLIRSLKGESIVIDDSVMDVRQAFQNSDLLVTPIEGPGGTRLKILEAMASNLPVVSTSVGVEGLNVEDQKEAFIINNYQKMGETAAHLLMNTIQAGSVANTAKKFVQRNYSWRAISSRLEKIYEQAKNQTN